MAKIFGNATGTILRFLATAQQEAEWPTPPTGTTVTISFDESTNATVVQNLNSNWAQHDCVGGVLRRNGTPVTIAPGTNQWADAAQLATYLANIDTFIALASPTLAQTWAQVKVNSRLLRLIVRRLQDRGIL